MYLLFDIGGTKMRFAVSKDGKTFGNPKILQTPVNNFEKGMQLFSDITRELADGEAITAAAGGIAGPLDREKVKLVNSPNIPGWIGKSLKKELQKFLDCDVYLENDTALVGLGEAHVGAGKGKEIVAYMTVSTGVGGVRIVNGVIDRSSMGFEIGHQYINMLEEGRLGGLISGTAIEKRFGKKAYEVEDADVWRELAHILAYGLNNIIVHWSPDVVVLGGSMIVGDPAIPLDVAERHLKDILNIFPALPELKKANLTDEGGLYGALEFLKQRRE